MKKKFSNLFRNLITLEMANNHMGDLIHGKRMVKEFANVVAKYSDVFQFAWKFQLRDIPTFIHPDYKDKMEIKYVKRFTETNLTEQELSELRLYAKSQGFITMCTAFDEKSVDRMCQLGFDIAKVASCSSTDWPLLNKLQDIDLPIIISTAGTNLKDVDKIVSFFQHRGQRDFIHENFAIMHCVGEYPTDIKNLQLNQIDLFKSRYKNVNIGFSTHENPEDIQAVKLAVAKGVTMFEKHVAVETENYPRNAYSATPEDLDRWLVSMVEAYDMCGVINKRSVFSDKEISDLRQFRRGVFAKEKINIGDTIDDSKVFYAWPNHEKQMLSIDMSRFILYKAEKAIDINEPIFEYSVKKEDTRTVFWRVVTDVKNFLDESGVVYPGKTDLEISHHYGIDNFYETGLTMITVVNREYCKKLLILLPGQKHPEQYHKKKEETFIVLYGSLQLRLNGIVQTLTKGNLVTIKPKIRHEFCTKDGCVIEEVSSTHYVHDSYYTDQMISKNKDRKTLVTEWTSWDLLKNKHPQ